MERVFKKIIVILAMAALIVTGGGPITGHTETACASGKYTITGYSVASGSSVIKKDQVVSIRVTMICTDATATNIEKVERNVDSFSGGTAEVGTGTDNSYIFTLKDLKYKGTGKTLAFTVKDDQGDYTDLSVEITECKEYEEPAASDPEPYVPEPEDQPNGTFSRNEFSSPVEAGKSFDVVITVENLGRRTMTKPVLEVTPSSELMLTGTSTAYRLSDIPAGKRASVTVPMKAAAAITEESQVINCSLSFTYNNNVTTAAAGECSGKILIPARITRESEIKNLKPNCTVSRETIPAAMQADQKEQITVIVTNAGTVTMKKPVIEFTSTAELMLMGTQNSYRLSDIPAGKSERVTIPVKTVKTVVSQQQAIDCTVSYTYNDGSSDVAAEDTGRIHIPTRPNGEAGGATKPDSPVPNIIIQSFSYGGKSVAAGSEFTLDIDVKNTSKIFNTENVVATVDGGTELILNGASNTFYFDSIPKNSKKKISVPFKIIPMITASAQTVNISFTYEYVENQVRKSCTDSLKVTVPCYQPDKFEIGEPKFAFEPAVYEETSFTMDYVNKGKSMLSNMEVEVSGDCECQNPKQVIGNVESGASGTVAFAVTPTLEGENDLTVKITYEDANGKQKERIFEASVNAYSMGPVDPGMDEPMEPMPEEKSFPKWILPVGIVSAAAAAVVLIRRKKKRSKAKKAQEKWEEFDLDKELGDQ